MKKQVVLIVLVLSVFFGNVEAQQAVQLRQDLLAMFEGLEIVIWGKKVPFANIDLNNRVRLVDVSITRQYNQYNANSNRQERWCSTLFIFENKAGVREEYVRNFRILNIGDYNADIIDVGMKVGQYGFYPYVYVKTRYLDNGHFLYYGKRTYYGNITWMSINVNFGEDYTVFLVHDGDLIIAQDIWTHRRPPMRTKDEFSAWMVGVNNPLYQSYSLYAPFRENDGMYMTVRGLKIDNYDELNKRFQVRLLPLYSDDYFFIYSETLPERDVVMVLRYIGARDGKLALRIE